ncbi:SusD/RagB family nutrient-binding outer membrane lipoprotein [Pedobacter alluvionis]|uniref:SusD-like starch-binding protein associating with outer membrane n=1 Tax=Pedobacter alluvionis TaxID=475253 RepID=A0A497XVH3_9SPHI|nr:SusD/RagB family nutrient-binding outer membrane lipoprotein [Pedobacter alluvionis]RLJ73634.1 SusD-like starch-binding protein associating with outer membrane [Pedobacter alluvionis]TFB32740.1 SusD/RagB family nutrient-binding outer membrane lipoprotein [Pedobacter alluvionis]
MKKFKYSVIIAFLTIGILTTSSCKKFFDINSDPDAVLTAPIEQQLSSLTVNMGFYAGSDVNRYTSLIMQQFSGQSSGTQNNTQLYEKYLIQGSDENNAWSSMYATILNDAENIIKNANETGNPHYSGVAKIIKAYAYQITVDVWGDVPFSETQKLTENTQPKYDSAESIYTELIKLLDQGIAEVSATTSNKSPGTNSTIYPGAFSTTKANWIKLANTLKLRIYLHYSEKNAAFAKAQIDQLINSGVPLFASNADNFQMAFVNQAASRNPIDQHETARAGYLVANDKIVTLMNNKLDPRRPFYFTQFPAGSGLYKGAISGDAASQNYSKLHAYLRGFANNAYTGDAPIRMLTFAEYNFIRAEAALRFNSPGVAQTFFTAGITASMTDAGVSTANIATYLAANGTLIGTTDQQLSQIITEKYIASYGVIVESWTDWRRTGYPAIAPPANAVVPYVPRSLYYPQSEIDLNPNAKQKPGLNVRVFWDTRQ